MLAVVVVLGIRYPMEGETSDDTGGGGGVVDGNNNVASAVA
jgi:hypothetical protein